MSGALQSAAAVSLSRLLRIERSLLLRTPQQRFPMLSVGRITPKIATSSARCQPMTIIV